VPKFAHVPLILGADKKRLSKRHGATSVMEYARQGYLPEAMINFLSLLGWSPGSGDQEVFTREQLLAVFGLEGISGGSAVFDATKLDWFNQQHLWRLPPDELAQRVKPLLEAEGLWRDDYGHSRRAWLFVVLELLKTRAKRLTDFVELGRYFFVDEPAYDPGAMVKHLRSEGMGDHLQAIAASFAALPEFDAETAEAALRAVAEARGVKAASLIHALRVALTGRSASPGLFEVAVLLGRTATNARIARAVRELTAPPS
jgi:glutamyl/glutaminyl-tRNA synthetase